MQSHEWISQAQCSSEINYHRRCISYNLINIKVISYIVLDIKNDKLELLTGRGMKTSGLLAVLHI